MKTVDPADAARVELFLGDLRLPAIKQVWATLAEQSDKEGWPAAHNSVLTGSNKIIAAELDR